jgi:hypothetical protein
MNKDVNSESKHTLPPESEDTVVEVHFRHIMVAFTALVTVSLITGSTLLIIRDYTRYRRQKAVIDAVGHFIKPLIEGKIPWKNEREDISLPTTK